MRKPAWGYHRLHEPCVIRQTPLLSYVTSCMLPGTAQLSELSGLDAFAILPLFNFVLFFALTPSPIYLVLLFHYIA